MQVGGVSEGGRGWRRGCGEGREPAPLRLSQLALQAPALRWAIASLIALH